MENKEMIIDGCNVSGCEFLRKCIIPDNYGCKIDDSLCCDVSDCYYKQLKHKEQVCKKLLEVNHSLAEEHKTIGNDLYKEIKEYRKKLEVKEQECEKLKKIINEAKNSKLDLKSFLVGEAVQNEYEQQLDQLKAKNSILEDEYKILEDNLDSRTRDFEEVIDNYKQTLTEIKEIAKIKYPKSLFTETFVEVINHCPYFDCGNCKCLENKEKQSCGGFICSRKQSVYYQENTTYFKQILQKISECEVEDE